MDFLDKLEQLLLTSINVGCQFIEPESRNFNLDKPLICIGIKDYFHIEHNPHYIQEYIQSLKTGEKLSKYDFLVKIFEKNDEDISIFDEILQLNPSDEELFFLYRAVDIDKLEVPIFLKSLSNKSSFITFLQKGNILFSIDSHSTLLSNCLNEVTKFKFSIEDYYTIFSGYIENTTSIADKDKLIELFREYINNSEYLEILIKKLYKENITLQPFSIKNNLKKIQINRLNLIKYYKIFSQKELDILLTCFVDLIRENIYILPDISFITYSQSPNMYNYDKINNILFNLFIDTNNLDEVVVLLDTYLKYFIDNKGKVENFTEHLKDNPQIFKNFILYKKLNKKLNNKNIKTEIIKI